MWGRNTLSAPDRDVDDDDERDVRDDARRARGITRDVGVVVVDARRGRPRARVGVDVARRTTRTMDGDRESERRRGVGDDGHARGSRVGGGVVDGERVIERELDRGGGGERERGANDDDDAGEDECDADEEDKARRRRTTTRTERAKEERPKTCERRDRGRGGDARVERYRSGRVGERGGARDGGFGFGFGFGADGGRTNRRALDSE